MESILAFNLARIEAHHAVTAEALDHLTLVIRNYHDSGNVESLRSPLGTLSSFLDRLGHFEAAATLAGYGLSPLAAAAVPELLSAIAHLREVLGDEAYESLARRGEAMTMAAIAAYAYDEIDQARTHLEWSAMSAPSGVVTFLFTDIEGSTRRWETDADAMRVALAAHDKALRSAIEAHDGFVFSHSGDGMAAAFASPMSAVEAAIDAQRELDLPVRMGIATGEAELRDNDYFGTV